MIFLDDNTEPLGNLIVNVPIDKIKWILIEKNSSSLSDVLGNVWAEKL